MALGLDGFLYDFVVDGKTTNFHFWDPEDATNTADVSISDKEVDGSSGSRETAEYAYAQVVKGLSEKRDARLAKGAADFQAKKQADEAQVRETATDFLNNGKDPEVKAVGTEKRADGVTQNVYNATNPEDKKK